LKLHWFRAWPAKACHPRRAWRCLKIKRFVWLLLLAGCGGARTQPDLVWGQSGVRDGDVVKPRAIAIDKDDRLYLVDWTARIQRFDTDGKHQGATWKPPDFANGRPSGLSIHPDGNLIVSDSHYSCIRIYSPDGALLRTLGGVSGTEPGQLSYISDAVCDADGNFYVAEFGENQRITKLDPEGKFVTCWGEPGNEPGQFARIRALALGPDGNLYAADACNHRIQVFTTDGKLVRTFGSTGSGLGELSYPYDLAFSAGQSPHLYVMEYGNQRVQKFTLDGKAVATWGGPGRAPGRLSSPWALAVDRLGRVHLVDSGNDRVQRIRF
jgi:DNA-binding beta-propeller fold protein YncE